MNDHDTPNPAAEIENPGSFASRLYLAREALGITQGALADRAGLRQSTIAHYEAGRREPNIANLRRLVWATGQSADYLLATRPGTDDDYRETPTAAEDAPDPEPAPIDDRYATQQRFDGQRASVGRIVVVAQLVHDEQGRSTGRTEIVGGSIAGVRHDLPVINTAKGDVYEPGMGEDGRGIAGLEFMPCNTERDVETMPANSWTWPVRV